MDLTERTVRVGARDLFVASTGSGPTLVLLHGGGPGASGVANWTRNIPALAEHFTLVIPDLPGYGRSTKDLDQSDPFGDLAAAVRGLLDELDIERAHLVGNSYGGGAALRLALDRPDRVDRMVLNGPGGIGTTRALPTRGLNQLLDYYGGSGPSREKMATFIRESLVADPSQITDEVIDGRYQSSLDPEVMANPPLRRPSGKDAPRTLWRMDLTRDKRLTSCEVPTLVIWGTADKVNRPSGAWQLATRMPRGDAYLAAGVGHWVQWEAPELFNRLAVDFLTGVAR
ncbi:MAG TPA: alpha/beta fold hydrolase [Phycicoccus sp.]|nr:alpha/beta fold hydrolase [Phycicoccus sp.]HQY96575.1 alpha/beta fold hydrolase [Phycicoccus sp.]HRA44620.1 alpha/beta fold hydrolase [Phycicoccus sp.]